MTIADGMTPRNLWHLAIVSEVMAETDGMVHSLKVRTNKKNEPVRPITKVVLLEAFRTDDNWLGDKNYVSYVLVWMVVMHYHMVACVRATVYAR